MNISIVIATYNRPTHLASTALSSIQNQSERNFELVVVNDGANPDTKEIVTSFKASADFPVRYVEMEHPHPSRGKATEAVVRGKVVCEYYETSVSAFMIIWDNDSLPLLKSFDNNWSRN